MYNLSKYHEQIKRLCSAHGVKSLFAFGSVLTDRFGPESDIDLLVDISTSDPIQYAENYFFLKDELERLFNRKVDLLETRALRNPFLKLQIEKTQVLLYGN